MLRLEPPGYLRFVQADSFGAVYGGGEANVAVALANFGVDVSFVTKLPAHEIGQAALNSLRRFGVDTSKVQRGGDRIGIYFIEKGASQRASKVIYDRAQSAHGGVGAVIDGYMRDTRQVLEQNFPVFCMGRDAQGSIYRNQVIAYRVPVEIGNIRINPGDLLFGDIDGVVVIPREIEEKAITVTLA